MDERGRMLYARRSILGMAVSLLTAGCSRVMMATVPDSCLQNGAPDRFPNPQDWCWDPATTMQVDILGQLIMANQNPYCIRPDDISNASCQLNIACTWPSALTNEDTWKILTEFNLLEARWTFKGRMVTIKPSMRIPYLIKHSRARGKKFGNVGRENLLIGFEEVTDGSVSIAGALPWQGPSSNCPPGSGQRADPVGKLGDFVVMNMKTDKFGFYLPSWNTAPNLDADLMTKAVEWSFRGAKVLVDYPFRFGVAIGSSATSAEKAGRIYVGYEGGGAY
jgi:hypothetical protein